MAYLAKNRHAQEEYVNCHVDYNNKQKNFVFIFVSL
jgi:hypothetical protein